MTKFIIYSIIAYLALWYLRRIVRYFTVPPRRTSQDRERPGRAISSRMVRCEVCGTFVAESRVLDVKGKHICSEECLAQVR